ncbi:hypothetical protein GV827_07910 [Sulfitobacter sp. JBTF-M27]|uniref:DUF2946 domain-containing protein n=1 Tax=Sulfitobacter sediminilitoris TaxID=2698830 RepID=A0A6P0C856_9RHOB|nr:hypothetical protein [Sulfitobacter sediminilitoris]NEK22322.1 hypothetical protein [Sulfitobacter sediminilitoris]
MALRSLIALSLALMLALTSQVMAVTRVSTDATGRVVLCVGDQIVSVYVDDQGQPTTAPHICPDCALSEGYVPSVPVAVQPQDVSLADLPRAFRHQVALAPKALRPPTRAPPSFV